MHTYRNKHFESIAWNPGDGVYKAENFVFSPVSSLRSWRSHLFVWRLRKPINLAQVCISNDRVVPTPGLSNTIPDLPKQRQPNRHTEVLTIFILIFCSWWCIQVWSIVSENVWNSLGAITASVLLHNYIWSFDVRSLLIGVQKKLELQEKGIFLCWHRQKTVQ